MNGPWGNHENRMRNDKAEAAFRTLNFPAGRASALIPRMVPKPELRRMARARLLTLAETELAEKSRRICAHLAAHPAWAGARTVCLFAPQAREPEVELLWEVAAPADGRRFCYPRMNGVELDIYHVADRALLETARWQLREPMRDDRLFVALESIDLVLVPGLGFNREGQRLGRGGGIFDRFLTRPELRAVKLGVCFDVQLLDALPIEPHDRGVDHLITESGLVC